MYLCPPISRQGKLFIDHELSMTSFPIMDNLKANSSRLFRGCNSCRCFCVELIKLLPKHRYSVDIFYSLFLSAGKQNTS